MKKTILLTMMVLLLLYPVVAESSFIFKQGESADLEIPIYENDISQCTTCTCTITINHPNGTAMVRSDSTSLVGNYAIYTLNETQTATNGEYQGDIYCSNGADSGGGTFTFEITTHGKENPSEIVVVLFSILFLIILFSLIGMVVYTIGHFIQLDFDMKDMMYNFGAYFVLWGVYILGLEYMGNAFINDFLLWVIYIGALTNVILPVVALILSLTLGQWRNYEPK